MRILRCLLQMLFMVLLSFFPTSSSTLQNLRNKQFYDQLRESISGFQPVTTETLLVTPCTLNNSQQTCPTVNLSKFAKMDMFLLGLLYNMVLMNSYVTLSRHSTTRKETENTVSVQHPGPAHAEGEHVPVVPKHRGHHPQPPKVQAPDQQNLTTEQQGQVVEKESSMQPLTAPLTA